MSRLRFFLRCVGQAVCSKGLKALCSLVPMGEAVFEIAEDAYQRIKSGAKEEEQQAAIAAAAAASVEEVRREAARAVAEIRKEVDLPPETAAQLELYLERVPSAVRQSLRRPEDPSGTTVPPTMALNRAEQLVPMLPTRMPRFKPGDRPAGIGNWELVELLGSGGFGEVWKAKHPSLAGIAPVALKFCLDASAAATLRHEATLLDRVMQQGTHPGIVPLRQAYLDADPLCLEYEYVAGGDLVGVISGWHKSGKPPLRQVNAAILSLAKIVGHAHGLTPPIVHRDLKPANILVHRGSDHKIRLRVADFGIGGVAAAQAAHEAERATLTGKGVLTTSMRGSHTPLYASPQQIKGDAPDPRDDVHALGVIWYQMLTGDLSSGVPSDWMAVLEEKGQAAPLVRLLGECVTSRVEKRIATAGALAERLLELTQVDELVEVPETPAVVTHVPSPTRARVREQEKTVRPAALPPRTQRPDERLSRRDEDRTTRRREDEEERPVRRKRAGKGSSSALPLILVGGGAVLLLGVVALSATLLWPRGSRRPAVDDRPVVQGDPWAGFKGNPPKQKDETPSPAGRSANLPNGAVDLLPLIDLKKDVISGDWAAEGQALRCKSTGFLPRIQAPYRPPEEYDYVVTYYQPSAPRNGVCLLMPKPNNGGSFLWCLGGTGSGVAFSTADDVSWIRNKNTAAYKANQRYTTSVRVRRDKVSGLLDGKVILEVARDEQRLGASSWYSMKDTSCLGFTCDDPTVFESAYVVEVSGKGTGTRSNDPPRNESPVTPPGSTVDLLPLIDLSKDVIGGGEQWQRLGKALHFKGTPPKPGPPPHVQIPYRPPEEYDFVVRFSKPRLENGISLILPKPGRDGSTFWFISGGGSACGFAAEPPLWGKKQRNLITQDKAHTTTVQVRRGRWRALIDGEELLELTADLQKLGTDDRHKLDDDTLLGLWCDNPTTIEAAHVVEVKGKGTKTR
jgi:serine/threonine protein kinase